MGSYSSTVEVQMVLFYQSLRNSPQLTSLFSRGQASSIIATSVEVQMVRFYQSLSERDRRRYAAIEAVKFGHGGIEFISQLLACDPKTVRRGIAELESEHLNDGQQRKKWLFEILSG